MTHENMYPGSGLVVNKPNTLHVTPHVTPHVTEQVESEKVSEKLSERWSEKPQGNVGTASEKLLKYGKQNRSLLDLKSQNSTSSWSVVQIGLDSLIDPGSMGSQNAIPSRKHLGGHLLTDSLLDIEIVVSPVQQFSIENRKGFRYSSLPGTVRFADRFPDNEIVVSPIRERRSRFSETHRQFNTKYYLEVTSCDVKSERDKWCRS